MKTDKKSSFFVNIKKTWKYIKSGKWSLVGYLIVSMLEAISSAIFPLIEARIILQITDGLIEQLVLTGVAVFLLEIVLQTVYISKSHFYNNIYDMVNVNLQTAIAKETLKLEIKEIDKESSGVFIDRLNRDTGDISGVFMEYTYWLSVIISNVGVLVAMFLLNKYMFLFAIYSSLASFFINKKGLAKQYEFRKSARVLHEKKTGLTSELVRGIRDIKVLNAKETLLKETTKKIKETVEEERKMRKVQFKYDYISGIVRVTNECGFLLLGCFLFTKGLLTLPVFLITYNYQWKVQNLLRGVAQIMEFNKKFTLAADRIFEIIEDERFAKEKFGNLTVEKLDGHIEFKDVVFGYDKDRPVLDKMNFSIRPNEKVAFVGKSGAGKTTIFSLITKLYNIDSGDILLDGHSIASLDEASIRDNMSIITQNPYIFNFSIKENLLLAKEDASMEELREACKMACIDEYIMSLPEQYDTLIGENGIILSGGQKQRLAIARALLMKTEIILFDEATSALDNETQGEIQQAIENLQGEYTILIVAHRLSTVIDADEIFVVDEGKILDSGTHKQLLKKCPFYKALYEKDLDV